MTNDDRTILDLILVDKLMRQLHEEYKATPYHEGAHQNIKGMLLTLRRIAVDLKLGATVLSIDSTLEDSTAEDALGETEESFIEDREEGGVEHPMDLKRARQERENRRAT